MIASSGHIKLIDFGLSKRIINKSYTICGTPDYIAPEVILGEGHNQAVDWWSFGILMYKLLIGYTPFYDPDPYTIYKKVVKCKFSFEKEIDNDAKDLINRLLKKDVDKRIGCLLN